MRNKKNDCKGLWQRIENLKLKVSIDMELQLKDLESVEKKLDKVKRAAKTGNKEAQKEEAVLSALKEGLEAGKSVHQGQCDPIF